MTPRASTRSTRSALGFEVSLWQAADALRNNMDAAEYKHVVLGLIFLKYISDAFDEQHARLEAEREQGADPEDQDEYRAVNIFWVPREARWSHLKDSARQPTIGQTVDEAMAAIERDNPSLNGVLPRDCARPGLDKQRLGQLIDLVSNIGLGDQESRSKDILGRVYEYFLSQFASAEGKKSGPGDIRKHGHVLTPGRYVGAAAIEDDGEPFDEKMERLTAQLREQTEQGRVLDAAIWRNLEDLGYGN